MNYTLKGPTCKTIRSFNRYIASVTGVGKRSNIADHRQHPDFTTPEKLQSFQLKANHDLLRTWIILRLSAIDTFVNHSEKVGCFVYYFVC